MSTDVARLADLLTDFEIGEVLGRGAWGVVISAHQTALDRSVAVKVLPTDAADVDAVARFRDEARMVAALDHPHIVRIHDFRNHDDLWMIVMEHLTGGSLADRFGRGGIDGPQAVAVAIAMCSALAAAHAKGVLHRDLKPDNILFTGHDMPRLADFGIARLLSTDVRRTAVDSVLGTPLYMSPEQARGDELGPPSDIYSLGIVLYELLAGSAPFPAARTLTEQLLQHVQEEPGELADAAPEVPTALARVIMASLVKDPAERFPSALDFGEALARAAADSWGGSWLGDTGISVAAGSRIDAAAVTGSSGVVLSEADDLAAELGKVPMFFDLRPADLERLARDARAARFEPGDELVREGELGVELHVLMRGRVDVEVGGEVRRTAMAGEVVGELSMLDGQPRLATLRAAEPVETVVLDRPTFLRAIEDDPAIARAVIVSLAGRLRQAEGR